LLYDATEITISTRWGYLAQSEKNDPLSKIELKILNKFDSDESVNEKLFA